MPSNQPHRAPEGREADRSALNSGEVGLDVRPARGRMGRWCASGLWGARPCRRHLPFQGHMPTFICPHCQHSLEVAPQHLGQRGRCNRCGGRIALVGRADAQRPQLASKINESAPAPRCNVGVFPVPPTAQEPPSKSQMEYLTRLGATPGLLERVKTKAQASALIERILALL